jgi:hypothetical protein
MKYSLALFLNGSYKLPFGHINNFWKKVPKLSGYNSPNTLRKFFQVNSMNDYEDVSPCMNVGMSFLTTLEQVCEKGAAKFPYQ